jgi:hypothetical protein
MRAMKSVLQTSGQIRKTNPLEKEESIVVKSIKNTNISKLLD